MDDNLPMKTAKFTPLKNLYVYGNSPYLTTGNLAERRYPDV